MSLPVITPDREPLTEAEVRRIGVSAHQLASLRATLKQGVLSATLTVKTSNGHPVLALGQLDAQAVLGLLVDREVQLLSSFNVTVENVS